MLFGENRQSGRRSFFPSDVIRNQWIQAAREGNFLNHLPRSFILRTSTSLDNESIQRVMRDFGLRETTRSLHPDGSPAEIHVEPDPRRATTAAGIQKANQHLSPL